MTVTDPVAQEEFLALENGEYPLAEAILCISLGELLSDFACKLVAALIIPARCGGA